MGTEERMDEREEIRESVWRKGQVTVLMKLSAFCFGGRGGVGHWVRHKERFPVVFVTYRWPSRNRGVGLIQIDSLECSQIVAVWILDSLLLSYIVYRFGAKFLQLQHRQDIPLVRWIWGIPECSSALEEWETGRMDQCAFSDQEGPDRATQWVPISRARTVWALGIVDQWWCECSGLRAPDGVRRMDPDPYYQNWSVSACSLVRLGWCIGSFSSRSTTICKLALTVIFLTCFTFQTLGLAIQNHQVWLAIFFRIGWTWMPGFIVLGR